MSPPRWEGDAARRPGVHAPAGRCAGSSPACCARPASRSRSRRCSPASATSASCRRPNPRPSSTAAGAERALARLRVRPRRRVRRHRVGRQRARPAVADARRRAATTAHDAVPATARRGAGAGRRPGLPVRLASRSTRTASSGPYTAMFCEPDSPARRADLPERPAPLWWPCRATTTGTTASPPSPGSSRCPPPARSDGPGSGAGRWSSSAATSR